MARLVPAPYGAGYFMTVTGMVRFVYTAGRMCVGCVGCVCRESMGRVRIRANLLDVLEMGEKESPRPRVLKVVER